MNIQNLHRKAIDLAKQAKLELEAGRQDKYQDLILDAYKFEKQAAESLKNNVDSEPTRSVLYRSAANLAFKCERYYEATELITEALSGKPFEEIKQELLELLKEIIGIRTNVPIKRNDFLDILREKSITLKMEEKTEKYSGAFVIAHAIEFLKNINLSYQNYAETKFRHTVKKESIKDFDLNVNKFKTRTALIGTNTQFNSFGISISANNSIMDQFGIHTEEFKNMKQNLFAEFSNDVLLADYSDVKFQEKISKKFSDEERRKIFSPLLNSMANSKEYKISVIDEEHFSKIKDFTTIDLKSREVLAPSKPTQIAQLQEDTNLVRKIEQNNGNKKKTIFVEQLKYFEQEVTVNDIISAKKTVFLVHPHSFLIIFESNYYRIEDNAFQIFVSDKDYNELMQVYSKNFIDKFTYMLLNRSVLSDAEIELLGYYENNSIRSW